MKTSSSPVIDRKELSAFFEKFPCKKCGKCCTEGSGIVLSKQDMVKLSIETGLSMRKFKDEFTFVRDNKRFLRHPCPFYKDKCTIYRHRPNVCVLYPANIPVGNLVALNLSCPEVERLRELWAKSS